MSGSPVFWRALNRYQSAGFRDTPLWLNWLFWLIPRLLVCSWRGHNSQKITDCETGEFTGYCCDVCGECWAGIFDE